MNACVRDVFAIYDNNISPRLIMIIIKIIILYFIQIRHTDDFPSTGTRLVYTMGQSLEQTISRKLKSGTHDKPNFPREEIWLNLALNLDS